MTERAKTAWAASGRITGLDGLRAVSILLVLCGHAKPERAEGFAAVLVRVAREAKIGVDVFFVISGFLITLLLLRESDRDGSISLPRFYARRALRLVPALAAYLLSIAALARAGVVQVSALDWVAASSYAINLMPLLGHRAAWVVGHLWSLSVEEHFYLIWPAILAWLGRSRALAVLMVVLAAAPTVRVLLWEAFPADVSFGLLRVSTPARLDTIGTGCLLGFLLHDPGLLARRTKGCGVGIAWASAVVLVASCLIYSATGFFEIAARNTVRNAMVAGLVAFVLFRPRSRLARLLDARPMAALGCLSYSLYLWQQPFFDPTIRSPACHWPANVLLALACAVASYTLIERPFLRLKDRIAHPTPPPIRRPHIAGGAWGTSRAGRRMRADPG